MLPMTALWVVGLTASHGGERLLSLRGGYNPLGVAVSKYTAALAAAPTAVCSLAVELGALAKPLPVLTSRVRSLVRADQRCHCRSALCSGGWNRTVAHHLGR